MSYSTPRPLGIAKKSVHLVTIAGAFSVALGGFPSSARAEHVRLHVVLDAAKALGGFQQHEFSFGGAGLISAELPLVPQLGAELQVSTLLMAKGDPPSNPAIAPEGGAHAVVGTLGLVAHPFAADDPARVTALTGLWASAHVGATTTGGLFRAATDLQAGYDFLLERGRYGIGPTVGLLHVFQPDSELRPEDANIFLFGVHAVWDTTPPPPPSDRDHDGLIDQVDACPDDPEDKDGFEDADGCPDPDNDKDGVLDSVDHCPNDAEDVDGFEDQDGCPDPDNDKDGIPDKEDLCPNEPETKNGYADEDGCPDEDQVRVVGQKIVLDDRVHFEENNARIREVSYPLLERLSKLLRDHPEYVHVEVQGHTDQRGTAEYNRKLSEDRANSVLEFLVKHGIERSRLNAVGFGAEHLLVDKANERALFLNRRVEFQITRQHVNEPPAAGSPEGASPSSGPGAPPPAAAPPPPPPAAAPDTDGAKPPDSEQKVP